jgi:hypothetical protein
MLSYASFLIECGSFQLQQLGLGAMGGCKELFKESSGRYLFFNLSQTAN